MAKVEGDGNISILNGKTGEVIAQTKPGARVFSIKNTKTLINLSKQKDRESIIKLGRKVLDMINIQDSQPVQHT